MERLKQTLTAMVSHVQTLSSGPAPTSEQLQHKVKSMNEALDKDVVTAPRRIKDIIVEGFAIMGWDARRKVVKSKALFDFSHFLPALTFMLEAVQNWSPPVQPTTDELAHLSEACSRLWELDHHRLVPDQDYAINVQKGKNMYEQYDAANEPLFTFVDQAALRKPTYASFVALLDNYFAATGQSEVVSDEEKRENKNFLNLIMDTAVMQYVHQYLLAKGKTHAADREAFIKELDELWFGLYSRKTTNDSSGFEHVFVGEIKEDNQEITGFHNWIQLYLEEKRGNFDYRGFIKPKRKGYSSGGRNPTSCEQFISLQFSWKGAFKNVSSSFVGTSPEFEVALYTLCFFVGNKEEVVQVGPYRVVITCHTWPAHPKPGQKLHIATSFPQEAPLDENEAATKIQSQARAKLQYKKK